MRRKHGRTRAITEIIETSDVVYRGDFIVLLQSRVSATLFILSKEQQPHLLAYSMPDGLIFRRSAESEGDARARPYRRLQDDILIWQNFTAQNVKEWLRRNHLTTKEALASVAQAIYNGCNSVRALGAHRAKN